jgi:polar amino acid transport system substrate-binding protein
VAVFNENAAAVAALKNGQIDGIVVDLPTGVYLVAAEVKDGVMLGTLPASDPYGILLAKNSPLTACTAQAVDQLRADGTLEQLEGQWLESYTSVPALS